MTRETLKIGDPAEVIPVRGLKAEIRHLYGKGTASDPQCAILYVPAQMVSIRLAKVRRGRKDVPFFVAPAEVAADV
jgi:hypothetical protein